MESKNKTYIMDSSSDDSNEAVNESNNTLDEAVDNVDLISEEEEDNEDVQDEEIISTLDQLFIKNILVKEVTIQFQQLGSNIYDFLKFKLKKDYEGKCIEEGYVKKNSIKIIEDGLSYGILTKNTIKINVMFECRICKPIDNQIIACKVKNNTIAGIKAEFLNTDDDNSPIVVFISKEYKFDNELFLKYKKVNTRINIRVIGSRYELNDKFISIIASIVK